MDVSLRINDADGDPHVVADVGDVATVCLRDVTPEQLVLLAAELKAALRRANAGLVSEPSNFF